jgi:CheY-like chemotaxis protein/DNA-directed RNA polymerase specialized sigma24 family protein
MSLGQAIAPHLPFLRRYGRAVSGSQQSGDKFVSTMLEQVVANPNVIQADANIRTELYRLLHQQVAQHGESLMPAAPVTASGLSPESIADARLSRMPSLARQALLLAALEGFSDHEIATIIERDSEDVRQLIDDASDEISRQTRARILIIEDEPIIAMDIEMIVRDLGHDVVAAATTHREAVDEAKKHRPSLVLADIQLADNSSGIEAVQEILTEMDLPVIFITAFPERLLTGDRPEPAFLLTKPYQPATLRASIAQVLFFNEATVPA